MFLPLEGDSGILLAADWLRAIQLLLEGLALDADVLLGMSFAD